MLTLDAMMQPDMNAHLGKGLNSHESFYLNGQFAVAVFAKRDLKQRTTVRASVSLTVEFARTHCPVGPRFFCGNKKVQSKPMETHGLHGWARLHCGFHVH